MAKLDLKFHGLVLKNKDESVVPEDQWMVFLAKDDAVPAMLDTYLAECIRLGAAQPQIDAVRELILRVHEWRALNPTLLKTPDVDPGELR